MGSTVAFLWIQANVPLFLGKKLGALGESSVLSLECVTKIMELMFSERKAGERQDEEVIRLRSNDDFVYYISTVVLALLSKVTLLA